MQQLTSHCCPWVRSLALATIVAVLSPPAAFAQQVMISQSTGTTLFDLATGTTRWTVPELLAFYGGLVSADGRFAVAVQPPPSTPGDFAVRVTDMATGAHFDAPLSFEPRLAHPQSLAFYGLSGGAIGFGIMLRGTPARLDVNGLTLYGGCPPGTAVRLDLSGNGALLFVLCESGTLAVLDAATGAVLRSLTPGDVSFKSNFDGSVLILAARVPNAPIERVDSTTGAVLQSLAANVVDCLPFVGSISGDRRLALVSCQVPNVPLPAYLDLVLDTEPLAWGPLLTRQPFQVGSLRVASISPDNGTLYSSASYRAGPGSMQTHSSKTGAITAFVGDTFGILLISHPPLPPGATAAVTGSRVDLSWTAPHGSPPATAHALEIGTGPGLSNIGTVALGPEPSLSVPGVPTGRYYVRFRARNVAGVSAASNELVIDVQ